MRKVKKSKTTGSFSEMTRSFLTFYELVLETTRGERIYLRQQIPGLCIVDMGSQAVRVMRWFINKNYIIPVKELKRHIGQNRFHVTAKDQKRVRMGDQIRCLTQFVVT